MDRGGRLTRFNKKFAGFVKVANRGRFLSHGNTKTGRGCAAIFLAALGCFQEVRWLREVTEFPYAYGPWPPYAFAPGSGLTAEHLFQPAPLRARADG